MGRDGSSKINWNKTANNTWHTGPTRHGGYDCTIVYSDGVGYTATITGPSAPAPTVLKTRKHAKAFYVDFLRDKS